MRFFLFQWYFYVRQRDRAEEWKCQPKKFLTPEVERHEIIVGSITLFFNTAFSAVLACYIANGGYSTVYYHISDYGWLWFFLQWPVIFIYQVSAKTTGLIASKIYIASAAEINTTAFVLRFLFL